MKLQALLLAGALAAAPAAWASNCPNLVKEIDAILESKANVDEETIVDEDLRKEVKALRDEGEKLHEEGKHGESVETLEKALKMLKGETG
jgi:hypothetical protein